ncbi:MAG: hypothetical protein R3C59_27120 [Planctomycetaceae bacterium]
MSSCHFTARIVVVDFHWKPGFVWNVESKCRQFINRIRPASPIENRRQPLPRITDDSSLHRPRRRTDLRMPPAQDIAIEMLRWGIRVSEVCFLPS